VFVYIHGGSNIDGSGEGSWYTVAHHYNVVVVTFNYRLGPMGWFLHPALLTGDPKNDSGDFGTLDQIKALEWVQKNIDKFGGDRANVTLVGASAGAQNVTYLMHSPLAKDLFQKAIIESNYPAFDRERGLQVLKTGSLQPAGCRWHCAECKGGEDHVECT